MSKTIEFSDHDYARIQDAAAAEGKPADQWVIEKLPLDKPASDAAEIPLGPDGHPAKTMLDLFAGRIGRFNSETGQSLADRLATLGLVGVVDSGGAERLAERHSEVFGEMLEEERREGRP